MSAFCSQIIEEKEIGMRQGEMDGQIYMGSQQIKAIFDERFS